MNRIAPLKFSPETRWHLSLSSIERKKGNQLKAVAKN